MKSIRLWILNGQVRQYYLTYPNPSVRRRKNRVCQLMVFSSSLPVSRRYPSQWNLALGPEEENKKRGRNGTTKEFTLWRVLGCGEKKAAAAGHTNWAEFKAANVAVPSRPIQLQEKRTGSNCATCGDCGDQRRSSTDAAGSSAVCGVCPSERLPKRNVISRTSPVVKRRLRAPGYLLRLKRRWGEVKRRQRPVMFQVHGAQSVITRRRQES